MKYNIRNTRPLPSQEDLEELLSYNPDTGELFWKERTSKWFPNEWPHTAEHRAKKWNSRLAGKRLGNSLANGYRVSQILGHQRLLHRIIWKLVYGEDPITVDHINGIRTDNRLCNLRNVTVQENHRNSGIGGRNKSGALGVGWHKKSKVWRAYGTINGKQVTIGSFAAKEEAIRARKVWERENDFHPNHGRRAA